MDENNHDFSQAIRKYQPAFEWAYRIVILFVLVWIGGSLSGISDGIYVDATTTVYGPQTSRRGGRGAIEIAVSNMPSVDVDVRGYVSVSD